MTKRLLYLPEDQGQQLDLCLLSFVLLYWSCLSFLLLICPFSHLCFTLYQRLMSELTDNDICLILCLRIFRFSITKLMAYYSDWLSVFKILKKFNLSHQDVMLLKITFNKNSKLTNSFEMELLSSRWSIIK